MSALQVVSGFHVRGDDWILPLKLHALSRFCSRIVVLMDRCGPSTEAICTQFPKVEAYHHQNTLNLPDEGADGAICEEGIMRQWVWDKLAEGRPDWIVLGDADEIPTPDVVQFFQREARELPAAVELCYLHWVQLFKTPAEHIAGRRCVWSFERAGSTKKGVFVRFNPAKHAAGEYRYDPRKVRHCRMEPSPAHGGRAVVSPERPLIETPKLIHWKWVNWSRWKTSFQASLPKYQGMWGGMELKPTPPEWHWPDFDHSTVIPPKIVPRLVRSYDYTDGAGRTLFTVRRFDPKRFEVDPPGAPVALYRLPRVLEAAGAGGTVFVVEGERDVETLEGLGFVATCNSLGVLASWGPEHFAAFQGARRAIVVPDYDGPGVRHAEAVAAGLRAVCPEVRTLPLPPAKDLTDWVERGGTRERLLAILDPPPRPAPRARRPADLPPGIAPATSGTGG